MEILTAPLNPERRNKYGSIFRLRARGSERIPSIPSETLNLEKNTAFSYVLLQGICPFRSRRLSRVREGQPVGPPRSRGLAAIAKVYAFAFRDRDAL